MPVFFLKKSINQRAILIIPYSIGPATPANEWIFSANNQQKVLSLSNSTTLLSVPL